jgi:uncharacterized membrane protein
MTAPQPLPPLSRARSSWLQEQTADWVRQGLIDADTKVRILGSYEVQSTERRSLLALMLLGALMFGIGVLLLIGYNWARLPVNGKIAIILTSVALAFGASAVAFTRRHRMAGETLAFIGVLLYGNAIWLIAQVLHIRGNFPDAFMWWAIGALVCAWLVRSRILGVGAAVLVFVWVGVAAGQTFDRPAVSFVAVWIATMILAYEQKSRVMLAFAAVASIAWACWIPVRMQPDVVSVGAAALMGCAFYAIGAWHRANNPMGRAWETTGLVALVVFLVPLLMTDFHDGDSLHPVTWRSLVVILPSLLTAASVALGWLTRARLDSCARVARSLPADLAVLATAAGVAVWLSIQAAGVVAGGAAWTYAVTLTFSLLALALSTSLIHRALGSDSASDLTFGVCFGLAFLLVRWASLIDSMLWSGVMLLAASAAFFSIARMWRYRDRRPTSAAPPVLTGAA